MCQFYETFFVYILCTLDSFRRYFKIVFNSSTVYLSKVLSKIDIFSESWRDEEYVE